MSIKSDINAVDGISPSAGTEELSQEPTQDRLGRRPKVKQLRSAVSKVVYRLDRIFGDLVAIILGLGIVCLWLVATVADQQSTDLTVLRPNIKMWFAEAFDGRDAEFGKLELTWHPTTGNLVVTIEDAEIRGSDAEVLENFDLVRLTLDPSDGPMSVPRLINAQVRGGVLTYLEDEKGQVVAGLGLPEKVGSIEPTYRSGGAPGDAADFKSVLGSFEFIQIEDALICVRSERLGLDFNSEVEKLRVNFSEGGDLILSATGSVDQTSGIMPFSISSVIGSNFDAIRLRLNVTGARLDEIAPTKGRFWELRGLAAPVNLTTEVDFSRKDGLRSASVDTDIGSGELTILRADEARAFALENLTARASLAPGDERMDIETFNLNAEELSFKSSGFLTQLGNLNDGDTASSPVFNLSLEDIWANMTPTFPVESHLDGLNLIGQVDFDRRRLEISSGRLDVFDTVHDFDGVMTLKNDNTMESLQLNSTMSGNLKPNLFLELWPVNSFQGARDWIETAVLDSDMTQGDVELDFDEDFFESRVLTEERLKFRFAGKNTSVRYMQTLPPATNVSGRGEIIGNELRVFLDNGQVNAINLTGGLVEIPRLRPKNGNIVVSVDGQGSLSEFMRLADHPPFEIAKRYNVDPSGLSGDGAVTVKVTRRLIPFLPADQIDYQIRGNFTGASAPFELGEYELVNGDLSLDANRDRVAIEGPVDIGPWRAQTRWLETLGENAPPTKYSASGIIDADVLDSFGLASRTWFEGSANVQINAEGRGMNVEGAILDIDLTEAGLSQERIWVKPIGQPAKLSGQLSRGPDGGYNFENAQLNGSGVDILGQVSLDQNYRFQQMAFSTVSIASLIDGAVTITSDREAGRLGVDLDAAYLNVSPWTEDLFAERQSNLDVPLSLKGNVAELVLDENYVVTNSQIDFLHTGEVIETARLEALSDGKPLKLELLTREDRKRDFSANVPDASKAVSAFMGLDNTTGGRLEITASLPAAGDEGAYVGTADMRDFKVTEAPALAQLLSLGSLTGLADTLSGGSMHFEKFRVPFTFLGLSLIHI